MIKWPREYRCRSLLLIAIVKRDVTLPMPRTPSIHTTISYFFLLHANSNSIWLQYSHPSRKYVYF
ncbi:hypothetical protein AFSV47Ss_0047 [African swine fever virus]|uniref:Uncharacterized protein n=1 Tax=African swine fever virus TaxID=10497 RepID=A0A6G6AHG1_ASF|nr:hypothetical protein AFSV47Ss_0047 [African swine fever virus]